MKFDNASDVDSLCWQMRISDWPRGNNRARINNLFNGAPPFNEEDKEQNGININVNFLEGTVLSHDSRAQFHGAFMKPGQYFTANTDMVEQHKQQPYSQIVTSEINKRMKKSLAYFETFRSKIAMLVLHGIGPAAWPDADCWCPDAVGIEDVGIPSGTLLQMRNLPFFYIHKSYSAHELRDLTRNRKAAAKAGWNLPLVDSAVKWIDDSAHRLLGSTWNEIWSPEKRGERIKGDGGYYAGDQVPTIEVFDFYYRDDNSGWKRKMIIDAWNAPTGMDGNFTRDQSQDYSKGQFLFDPGDRVYAQDMQELISFQFADLSAVAPFHYHTVRSLGYLVYAICHLQNRMRCRFSESVFEALMNYYRVNSSDDVDRALKVEMLNRGFVDETIKFIPAAERWQVNAGLIELGISQNKYLIDSNSSSFTQQAIPGGDSSRKTKLQVMAEVSQTTALVSAAFNQAYQYQEFEYREIFRRFCKRNSGDPDVKSFQEAIQRKGVPLEVLQHPEDWNIEPVRVAGAGNKTMEMAIASQLLEMRNLFDPDPQREILREITFQVTGDADKALRWVPDQPLKVSDSVHDAQLAMGVLMQGLPVALKTGQNHKEYIAVMLQEMAAIIQRYEQAGMMPPDKIEGLQAVAQHVQEHLQIVAQDQSEKAFVAAAGKELGKLMNYVKAFAQRLQEQQQKQQESQGPDPEVQKQMMQAQVKAKLAEQSHAQKTAQRQVAFDRQQQQSDAKTQAEIARENAKAAHQLEVEREKARIKLAAERNKPKPAGKK